MELAIIGLGRMGGALAHRLLAGGHSVAGFDVRSDAASALQEAGLRPLASRAALAEIAPPRAVWLMLPAGPITDETIAGLADELEPGDALVDGGNSHYRDSVRWAHALASRGLDFADVGTSGGIWGLEEGFCLMVGARPDVYGRLEPLFESLAPPGGYAHVGPPGAGHFTKMVHNGIEYALMQAYGEGLELLASSDFEIDVARVAELWRHGSVIRSWLLDLVARALAEDPALEEVAGYVEDSGEGRWTIETAIERAVPTPTMALSLFQRFASRQQDSFANKLIAALRKEFGGHAVRPPPGGH